MSAASRRFGIRAGGLLKVFVGVWLGLILSGPPAYADKTIRIAASNLPPTLGNPYLTVAYPAIITIAAIFDGLTWIDREGEVQPGLAVAWNNVDETTWRLSLRADVTFSNGEPFDAAAVVAAFEYLSGKDGQATLVGREVAAVETVSMIDPLTVELKTKEPFPVLPRSLAAVRIPAPDHWSALGPDGFAAAPVGTGPFRVDGWTAGSVSLSAVDDAWRTPKFERLEIIAVPEQQARAQALQSGAVDIAISLSPDDRGWVEAMGGRLTRSLSAGNLVIALRTSLDGPIRKRAVRQALNYGVNKRMIAGVLMGGGAAVASQPVPPGTSGFNPALEPYWYDPGKARRLLRQAGYDNGFDLTFEVATGAGANIDTIYEQVAADLAAIGVRVTLRQITLHQLARKVYDGSWEGEGFATTMNTTPTLDALGPFRLHSCEWVKPWHCREEDMPLIAAARREFDSARRQDKIHELLRRYHDDPPAIYLVQLVGFVGLSRAVRNYESDFGVIRFHDLDIEAGGR